MYPFPSPSAFVRHCSSLFFGLALAASVAAQTYPSKPVNMIVAFPPGGGSDVLGRAVGKGMAEVFGQPVIVENVVGVGGSLGVIKAASAQPDGYTLLAGSPLELIYTPLGLAAAKNRPEDMRLAALVGYTPIAIVVRKDLPVTTLQEFVAFAKKSEKPLSFGSTGVGSLYHLMAEKALQAAGANGLHAPYSGMAPYLKDLMGGVIDFAVLPLIGSVIGSIESGQIKALALASSQPLARLPKLPLASATKGFEDYQFSIWIGIQTTAKTPDSQMAAVHRAAYTALGNPDIRKIIETAGSTVAEPMSLAQLDAFYKKEVLKASTIAKSIKLEPQ